MGGGSLTKNTSNAEPDMKDADANANAADDSEDKDAAGASADVKEAKGGAGKAKGKAQAKGGQAGGKRPALSEDSEGDDVADMLMGKSSAAAQPKKKVRGSERVPFLYCEV